MRETDVFIDINSQISNYLDTVPQSLREKYKKHIQEHKYFLESSRHVAILDSAAFESWREYVEAPAFFMIQRHHLSERLHESPFVIFLEVTRVWDELKKAIPIKTKSVDVGDAVLFYLYKHWCSPWWYELYFKHKLKKILSLTKQLT